MDIKSEYSGNVKQIIDLLNSSRREQKITVEQLCSGICTKSMLEKVEKGQRTINRNSLNRMLSRLGIDQKKYEKYLYSADYDDWKERNDIINAIEDGLFEKAEELINKYYSRNEETGKLEKQFCIYMRVQMLEQRANADKKKIEELYREALLITVPGAYDEETSKLLLSVEELNLMLECRNLETACATTDEKLYIFQGFIDYIDKSNYDITGKAKIYAKVVFYMYKSIAKKISDICKRELMEIYEYILCCCEKAIDILREDCKSYYLSELLYTYIDILSYFVKNKQNEKHLKEYKEKLEWAQNVHNAYIRVCQLYSKHYEMRECCYMYREEKVYCISGIIEKRRKMFGMTMTELTDNICSPRTLRRFERGEKNALEDIVDELLWRLGMSDEYINMGIITDSNEAIEIYQQYRRALNAKELNRATENIERLEAMLSPHPVNKQIIIKAKSMVKWHGKEIGLDEHIDNLKEALSLTINIDDNLCKNSEIFLSWSEISCINSIAAALKKYGAYEEAYRYVQVLVRYFQAYDNEGITDNFMGLYEVVMTFYGSLLGTMGRYDQSRIIFNKLNRLSLKLRRTNVLHYNMYNIAWNNNEQNADNDKFRYEIKECLNLCQLIKNKYYELSYLHKLQ